MLNSGNRSAFGIGNLSAQIRITYEVPTGRNNWCAINVGASKHDPQSAAAGCTVMVIVCAEWVPIPWNVIDDAKVFWQLSVAFHCCCFAADVTRIEWSLIQISIVRIRRLYSRNNNQYVTDCYVFLTIANTDPWWVCRIPLATSRLLL